MWVAQSAVRPSACPRDGFDGGSALIAALVRIPRSVGLVRRPGPSAWSVGPSAWSVGLVRRPVVRRLPVGPVPSVPRSRRSPGSAGSRSSAYCCASADTSVRPAGPNTMAPLSRVCTTNFEPRLTEWTPPRPARSFCAASSTTSRACFGSTNERRIEPSLVDLQGGSTGLWNLSRPPAVTLLDGLLLDG